MITFKLLKESSAAQAKEELEMLRSSLNLTEDEQMLDLAHNFDFMFEKFWKLEKRKKIQVDFSDLGFDDIPAELQLPFAKWCYSNIDYFAEHYPADMPSWYYMRHVRDVNDEWLVHFTNDACAIALEGFTYGSWDVNNLGLTTYYTKESKKLGGYDFAFALNRPFNKDYGSQCVVFRASGIEVYHNGDNEYQVIFVGALANDIVPVKEGRYGEYAIFNRHNGELEEPEGFQQVEEVCKWIVNNYKQIEHKL